MSKESGKNETNLIESLEKSNIILESVNDLITIVNDKFEREYINEKVYSNLTGYTKEEITGKSIFAFIHPEDKNSAIRALKNGFREGKGRQEFRVKHKKGFYLWLEFKGKTFIDSDGKKKAIIISRDITDRKKVEKRIIESEEKYERIITNLTDIILEVDIKANVTFVSDQCFDIMGYKPSELMDKNALNFIHPEDTILIAEAMKKSLKTKKLISIPIYRLLHKNRSIIYASAQGKHVKINNIDSFIVTIRDISTRKKIEEKLKESEEKYKSLINNLMDIIIELDIDGFIKYISPQCYEILGYHPNELIGKTALRFIHPEDAKTVAESMRNARDTKELIIAPFFKLLNKDGSILFASARGKHVIINGMDRYIVSLRNITNQIITENKLKESESRYRLISENANDLILIISIDLKIEYANVKPLSKLTGYSIDEVLGKRVLTFLHPDDQKVNLELFKESFEKKGHGTIEARLRHKEGQYIYVETNGRLFYNENGEPKALLITRDITERKKAENLILEDYKKLEELSQIKSELIMQASHEFKTPLSSIYAASQLLLTNFKDKFSGKSLEFIEMIYRSSQKLKQLIENLLDVSRIESGKLNPNLERENIFEIVNECYNNLKYWVEKKRLNIEIDIALDIILKVDKILIEQVIINLLSNAIKYTPPKGKIYIKMDVNNQWVDISIKDTGIGLTKKEIQSLFQKFGKINRDSNALNIDFEGSGLGLYISKEIIELHNGEILVESEGHSKGSTFTIRLPNPN